MEMDPLLVVVVVGVVVQAEDEDTGDVDVLLLVPLPVRLEVPEFELEPVTDQVVSRDCEPEEEVAVEIEEVPEFVVGEKESVTVPPDELVGFLLVLVTLSADGELEEVTEDSKLVVVVDDDDDPLLIGIELVAELLVVVELGKNMDDMGVRVPVSDAVLVGPEDVPVDVLLEITVVDDDVDSGPDLDHELVEPEPDARVLVPLRDEIETDPDPDSGTVTDTPELVNPVSELPVTNDPIVVVVMFPERPDVKIEVVVVLLEFEKVIEVVGPGRPAWEVVEGISVMLELVPPADLVVLSLGVSQIDPVEEALTLSEINDELPLLVGIVAVVLGDVGNEDEALESTLDELIAAPLVVEEPELVGVKAESVSEMVKDFIGVDEKIVNVVV
ncbi:hypothetical protein HD806DRAFT_531476 [Xylariaceae sp. AK1471]|nr:hypothetical protein HD806DRAFT_531476 [Xylariaceae sp. AK1471]